MQTDLPVAALSVANEKFLVASTIERCPKTMMLRELVMNAIEAATTDGGEKLVEIKAKFSNGARKLSIWNSGTGMTGPELHAICNLASSLYKKNSLDRNFGMGAKVAALPSNKFGLRYRSCTKGQVSEVVLGQRQGVYGRLPYRLSDEPIVAEVDDVSQRCLDEGEYDLARDWTEVVLFGNAADQDTVAHPYAGDPAVPAGWIESYLVNRFFRLPAKVSVVLDGNLDGSRTRAFWPAVEGLAGATRLESVRTASGIVVHYAFWAEEALPSDLGGCAAVVSRDEIYAPRRGNEWLLDAPVFGMPFGARHYTVFVELPDDYPILPDLYRQFLRFQGGDQRQVYVQDFAGLVRDSIPEWLREIIASFGPKPADYLSELSGELSNLIVELGIRPQPRGSVIPRGAEKPPAPVTERGERPPPPQVFEKPPQIIGLVDKVQIDERGLQGRVAKYYGATHQIFINLTYPSIVGFSKQLEQQFDGAAPAETIRWIAQEMSERVTISRIARGIIYSLGKRALGWTPDEVQRAQSPEALCVIADDYALLLPEAASRMARLLGIDTHGLTPASTSPAAQALREFTEAEQAAQRAMQSPIGNAAAIFRRISAIEAQRRNWPAAVEWARKALEANPTEVWEHIHLSRLLISQESLDEACAVLEAALSQDLPQADALRRQLSTLRQRMGRPEEALNLAREVLQANPADPSSADHLAGILVQQGALEEAAQVTTDAISRTAMPSSALFRRLAGIALKQQDVPKALRLTKEALEVDPADVWSIVQLAQLQLMAGEVEAAAGTVETALATKPERPGPLLRQLVAVEQRRRNLSGAMAVVRRLLELDAYDSWAIRQLCDMHVQQGDLDAAESLAREGLALDPSQPAWYLRSLSVTAAKRKNMAEALQLARESQAADPSDPWGHIHLSRLLTQQGSLEEACVVLEAALARSLPQTEAIQRQLSLQRQRMGQPGEALRLAQEAMLKDPTQPASVNHLADILVQQGALEEAEQVTRQAISQAPTPPALLLRRLSNILLRQQNSPEALHLACQALEADPNDPWSYDHLIGVAIRSGDLEGAEAFARSVLRETPNQANLASHLDKLTARIEQVA